MLTVSNHTKQRPREYARPCSFTYIEWRKLVIMGRGKHERFHSHRDDLGDPQTFANIDIIQIAHFDAIHRDDIARDFELIFQNAPEGFRDVEVQRQLERTFWIVRRL